MTSGIITFNWSMRDTTVRKNPNSLRKEMHNINTGGKKRLELDINCHFISAVVPQPRSVLVYSSDLLFFNTLLSKQTIFQLLTVKCCWEQRITFALMKPKKTVLPDQRGTPQGSFCI